MRCFSSLLYTYRRYLVPATGDRKKDWHCFTISRWKSLSRACRTKMCNTLAYYSRRKVRGYFFEGDLYGLLTMLIAFNEFIHERETKRPDDPTIRLFDEVILAKRNRGKSSFFHKSKGPTSSPTRPIISGAPRPPIHQTLASQGTIAPSSVEVSLLSHPFLRIC